MIEQADWRLEEPAQGSELSLVVPVPSPGSCGFFERAEVSETGDAVTIETFVRRHMPGAGEACPDDLAFETVTVTLETDIGNRTLEGCDAPPGGNIYFSEPIPPDGCSSALLDR